MNLVRNESPYWELKIFKSVTEAEKPLYAGDADPFLSRVSPWLAGSAMPSARLQRKLRSIKVTQNFAASNVDSAELIFENLSVDEAESQAFNLGTIYKIILGWWNTWGITTTSNTMYVGSVQGRSLIYGSDGIKIELNLLNVGSSLLMVIPTVPIYTGSEANVTECLESIAKYLHLKLVVYVDILEPTFKKHNLMEAKDFALGKKSAWKYIPVGAKNPTVRDYLDYIQKRTGLVWSVAYNCLFVGPPKHLFIKPLAKKYFQYGEQGETRLFIQLSHLSSTYAEPYVSVEVDDNTGITASSSGVVDDPDKKNETSQTNMDSATIRTHDMGTSTVIINQEKLLTMNKAALAVNQALAVKEEFLASISSKVKNAIPAIVNSDATGTKEDEVLRQTARNWSESEKAFRITVKGVIGDPFFNAGDVFWFTGLLRHTGAYTAKIVEHYYSSAGYYIMNITGQKGVDPLVQTAAEKKIAELGAKAEAEQYQKLIFFAQGSTGTQLKGGWTESRLKAFDLQKTSGK